MKNIELANIFNEIADILEIKGVQWKPQAYRKAARSLESLSGDVAEIYKKGGIKALQEIPGIGESIAKKIEEYLRKGSIEKFRKLQKLIPRGVEEMMRLEGLGPKKALALHKKLGIKSLEGLEESARKGRIRALKGFGRKTEKAVLESIGMYEAGKKRQLL